MRRFLPLLMCVLEVCMGAGCMASPAANVAPNQPSQPAGSQAGPLEVTTTSLPVATSDAAYDATLTAQGGEPPYKWSLESGTLPKGLTMSSSGVISGKATSLGQDTVTVSVADSSVDPTSAQASLAIVVAPGSQPGTTSTTSTTAPTTSYYGSGIGSDGLGNTTVGPNGNTVSYRFRAKHSGSLQKLHVYLIPDHVGYAAGTGGELQISVESDDQTAEHNPSGTKLATAVIANPLAATGAARYFPLVSFSSPATIVAGDLYHIVFTNIASTPTIDYLSVDALYHSIPTTPNQPMVSDLDSAVLLRSNYWSTGVAWLPRKGYTPILELYYSDGASEGCGYIEAWIGAPQIISGTSTVRETFTVSGAEKTVSSVTVRVSHLSGSDYLKIRLEKGDGTLIEEGYIPGSSIPLTTPASYVWATLPFSSTHNLATGQTYHVILEAPSSSRYEAFPIRKGSNYGFTDTTYFPDGYAQFKQGSSWVGWTEWGVANRTDGDLQFYFASVP